MTAMAPAELYALTQKYFGDLGPAVVNEMYLIALRESGGDPQAKNLVGPDRSYGLWQINTIAGANPDMLKYDLTNPEQNAMAAREIYNRQGPAAWATYSGSLGSAGTTGGKMNLTADQITALRAKVALDFGSNEGGQLRPKDLSDIVITPDGGIVILGPNGEPYLQLWATPDGKGYTFEKPKGPDSSANQQSASLPTGYAFDPNTGTVYRVGDSTRTPVSSAELQAAAIAETQWGKNATPPSKEFQINPRTGDLVGIDPVTGQMTTIQKGFGYPEVSPAQQRQDSLYGIQESGRQADQGFRADIYGTQESGRQSDNSLAVSLYGTQDTNAIRRAELGQKDVIDRAQLMENARQANLQAALEQFKTRAALIPEFGQLALNEADIQRQILSQGGDFIYRAARSQGENSPLPLVTQADLIGYLRGQLGQLDNIIPPEALQSGATNISGFSIPAAAPPPTLAPMAPAPAPIPMATPKVTTATGETWTPTTANSGATIYVPDAVPDWVKSGLVNQYASGSSGFVFDRAFISGDPKPGQQSKAGANPEMVYNPTGAPIAVKPLDRMPPQVNKNRGFSMPQEMPEGDGAAPPAPWGGLDLAGWTKMWQGILDRWHSGYEQVQQARQKVAERIQQGRQGMATIQPVRGFATGTTYAADAQTYQYPTTTPTPLPDFFNQPTPTQAQYQAAADKALPPAIRALYQGGAPKQRSFDSSLPTLRQLSMLTDEELKAYDAYSRLKDQTPLSDIAKEIYSRYAPSATGFSYKPKTLIGIGL